MPDADLYTANRLVAEARAERDALQAEVERFREAARDLRRACHDANSPTVPTPVAVAITAVCELADNA